MHLNRVEPHEIRSLISLWARSYLIATVHDQQHTNDQAGWHSSVQTSAQKKQIGKAMAQLSEDASRWDMEFNKNQMGDIKSMYINVTIDLRSSKTPSP